MCVWGRAGGGEQNHETEQEASVIKYGKNIKEAEKEEMENLPVHY